MTTRQLPGGNLEITAAENTILHRRGDKDYDEKRRAVIAAADLDNWEEIAASDIPPYTEDDYAEAVEALIRRRYSVSDEIAVIRQRDTKPDEFAAYDAYAEQCKTQARLQLTPEPEMESDMQFIPTDETDESHER